jgi:hypothetical protein
MMAPLKPRNGAATNWLLGLFAAVLLALLGVAQDGLSDSRNADARQDVSLALLQSRVSTDSAVIHLILAKVDSILHSPAPR